MISIPESNDTYPWFSKHSEICRWFVSGYRFHLHFKPQLKLFSAILSSAVGPNSDKDGMHHTVTKHKGIITLYRHQKAAFAITSRRGPAPKAPKAPIADLPTGSSGSIPTELDEVKLKKFAFIICMPTPPLY